MAVERHWMALHLQEELELQGIKLGPMGVDLGKLTDAAMAAVRTSEPNPAR